MNGEKLASFHPVKNTSPMKSCSHDFIGDVSYLGSKGRTESALQPQRVQRFEFPENVFINIDKETGEVSYYQVTPPKKNKDKKEVKRVYKTPKQLRAERYRLKSVVNSIFPKSETAKCQRAVIPNQKVKILKSLEFNKAHYTGLRRCSSVWLCPICAAKIAERRRAELVAATATAKAMGWQTLLMTLTIPHGMGDDLNDILDKMTKAWRKVTTTREGKRVHKMLGVEGTIRALEVTDGKNGFHPHFHVLVFAQPTFTASSFQAAYLPLWQDACIKVGLPCPSEEHGLKVDDGEKAAKYVSKWGLEDEMTKGHTKTSKGDKGMTPWDMLRDVLETGSERSRARFFIYGNAFKGRRQLYWSNGLKEKLAVDEVTDEQLAMMEEERAAQVAELIEQDWKAVVWSRSEAVLLDIAEDNPQDIPIYLDSIRRDFNAFYQGKSPPS